MKKMVQSVKRNLVWNEQGDFIQNAIWIVLIVLAMIPMFGALRTALTRAFNIIIQAIQQLG
jgi:Flp pilus assembly pilin Flp